ncbi:MAG: hypothetical protein ACREVL_03500 [Solimonas sp.]
MKARTLVRGFAVLDVAVTAPLAVPGLGALWLQLLLGGAGLLPPPEAWSITPPALLFAQLAGVLGACWNGARARWPDDRRLVGIDAVARVAVAVLLLFWLLSGAPPVLGLFIVTELAGAAVAVGVLRRRA